VSGRNPGRDLAGADLRALMGLARAFVFAAEEESGVAVFTAPSQGETVVARGRGGMRETVVVDRDDPAGIFFDPPLPAAIFRFICYCERGFIPAHWRANAARVEERRCARNCTAFINEQVRARETKLLIGRATHRYAAQYLAKVAV